MNLVVGATGLLGHEICRQLTELGKPLRALVRSSSDTEKVEALQSWGGEIVYGDLKDPRSLDAACRGAEVVISTASATKSRQEGDSIETVDGKGQISLIDAAENAGVEHFIFVSFRNDTPAIQCPLSVAKRAAEQHLKESGLTYTILWPSLFMEAWLTPRLGFDYPNARARISGTGSSKISYISYRDVARFAVASIDNPAAKNATIELGGPEALSPLEAVRIFEELSGREFEVEYISEEALQARKDSAQDSLQESIAVLMLSATSGDIKDMESTVKTFPMELTSVRDYAKSVLG
jgi:uncharacterized protein YbjT (DUF2867 family)